MRTELNSELTLSTIIHGHWRLGDWGLTTQDLSQLIKEAIDLGVTSFDHADIYGNHECEALFGQALKAEPGLRNKMELISKTGIALDTDKFPERNLKYYDYSPEYIISSVEKSLVNFGTDHLDLLLLHRPSPFFDPEAVAGAFAKLKAAGKVLHFGVSNFTSGQFDTLNSFVEDPLVTNQIEISPYCLEHFVDDNIDYLQKMRVKPMAWSPLAGGSLIHPQDEKGVRIAKALRQVKEAIGATGIDQVIYCWLLKHPASIMPIVGSGKIDRLRTATEAIALDMSLEQWFNIYIASNGVELP